MKCVRISMQVDFDSHDRTTTTTMSHRPLRENFLDVFLNTPTILV